MLAVAPAPVPPSLELMGEVGLFLVPSDVPVTLMEKVPDAPTARAAPDSEMEPLPAAAVIVPPPTLPLRPLGVATTRPVGSVSVKLSPVSVALGLGLVTVKLSVVAPFTLSGIE